MLIRIAEPKLQIKGKLLKNTCTGRRIGFQTIKFKMKICCASLFSFFLQSIRPGSFSPSFVMRSIFAWYPWQAATDTLAFLRKPSW